MPPTNTVISGPIPEDIKYFTVRKIKGGWVAESLCVKDGILERIQLCPPGGRVEAINMFKISVMMYWQMDHRRQGAKSEPA